MDVQNYSVPPGNSVLGRVSEVQSISHAHDEVPPSVLLRKSAAYGISFITAGAGLYHDAQGKRRAITAGDLILTFPNVAHHYGPEQGDGWSEYRISFEGAAFDALRDSGTLNPGAPIWRLEPIIRWQRRIEDIANSSGNALQKTTQVLQFLANAHAATVSAVEEPWLQSALQELAKVEGGDRLHLPNVAQECGIAYDIFRRRFTKLMGISPGLYRRQKLMEHGADLMLRTRVSSREAAAQLGFGDEFHFSRIFRKIIGMSPRDYIRTMSPQEGEADAARQDRNKGPRSTKPDAPTPPSLQEIPRFQTEETGPPRG